LSKACGDCHNDARVSMRGIAARYPAFDQALGRPVNLEQRINLCRVRYQQATPFAYESHELLALTAFVAEQSRGVAIETGADPAAWTIYRQRARPVHAPAGAAQSWLHELP